MVRQTDVQSQVESYQKCKPRYLMFNTQHYMVLTKGKLEQFREWSSILPYTQVWLLLKKPSAHLRLRSPNILFTYAELNCLK